MVKGSNNNKNKINLKNSNKLYNVNVIKETTNSLFISSLIINIIFLIGVAFIINYLNNLKKCSCYQEENSNKTNIDYLIIIETVMMVLIFLQVIYILYVLNRLRNFNGGSDINNMTIIIFIYYIIYYLIFGYFVYYVYLLSKNLNKDCECSNSSIKYLLYVQAILIFFNLVIGLIRLLK